MIQQKMIQTLKEEFISRYGDNSNTISITIAPARVNIIGEHIDYNGGLVFPSAIDLYLIIALRKRNDSKIIYQRIENNQKYTFNIYEIFTFNKKNDFANYLNGVIKYLKEKKLNLNSGFEILISSNIPAGSGLSSSAALELCFTQSICSNYNLKMEKLEMAKLGMKVENEFLGLHSGIMDQAIIAIGKQNNAVLLDTATLDYKYIPLYTTPFIIVIMNTNKHRKLTDSKYNERKNECDIALNFFQKRIDINFLCDLDISIYNKFKNELILSCGNNIAKRVKHCITEINRVNQSVEALKSNNIKKLGKFLLESHISLKDDYEVTGKELDSLVFNAIKHPGCVGARMTGAGFSGCAIALVKQDEFKDFSNFVGKKYTEETGLKASFFPCNSANGVQTLNKLD